MQPLRCYRVERKNASQKIYKSLQKNTKRFKKYKKLRLLRFSYTHMSIEDTMSYIFLYIFVTFYTWIKVDTDYIHLLIFVGFLDVKRKENISMKLRTKLFGRFYRLNRFIQEKSHLSKVDRSSKPKLLFKRYF